MKSSIAVSVLLATTALASPTPTLEKRASQVQCGQYTTITANPYWVETNLWGEASGTGGQCSSLISNSGNNIAWSTNWTWSGGQYQVKSYTNVQLQFTAAQNQVSAIKSIPTTWDYTYTGSDIIADVAYDLFTTATKGSTSAQYEIMVWLDALGGAGPISASGSPVATPNIGGSTFKLYSGMNGATTVYSFVASTPIPNYSGDLINFFNYLETSQGFSKSQYLISVQAGTEPFSGSNAVLTTSKYSVSVQT